MRFDIITIFPSMFVEPLAVGVIGRAIEHGTIDVGVHDLRDFTGDRHRVVDDVPYGGGPGMVLKAEPIFKALDRLEADRGRPSAVILTSPQGLPFTQREANRLSRFEQIVLVCGRYEGIDERTRSRITEEISIGDYVLSGGEVAALVVIDAVARLLPGVVGDQRSVDQDSFSRGLLDFPHYTRPAELVVGCSDGSASRQALTSLKVPEVLLSGNHSAIRRWRKWQAVRRTLDRRPDLLSHATLDDEERRILEELTGDVTPALESDT
jgi:tRNA (guanine37-N1)-methyltransferase